MRLWTGLRESYTTICLFSKQILNMIRYDPGNGAGQRLCSPGVHSLEAGDRLAEHCVLSPIITLWEQQGQSSQEHAQPCLRSQGGLLRVLFLPNSKGLIALGGLRNRRPCGKMKRCCRHEPVPLMLQQKRGMMMFIGVSQADPHCKGSVRSPGQCSFYTVLICALVLCHRPSWGHGSSCWFSSRVCVKGPHGCPL